ncbi:MAG TPA: ABC transporter permease [Polyangiaceae bacterium]|nr:ABC transporter permease [Polyangiaceae bacterium]
MKAHRVGAIVLRQVYEARHNLDRFTDALYWPVIDVLLWGFMSVYLGHRDGAKPGFASFLLGTAILWGVFRNFQRDVAVGFLSEIWARNLIGLFSTPLSVSEYVSGLIIVNLLKAAAGMVVAGLVAWIFYSFDIFPLLPRLLPHLGVLMVFALAVGILVTGLIFRYSTRIQSLSWSITGLLMPFSCVFYPLDALPRSMRPIALALPTTHAFEGMRLVMSGGPIGLPDLVAGYGLDALYLALATVAFTRLFQATRSRGLLVKLE